MSMTTWFEFWDGETHNVLQFEGLDRALAALRELVERDGARALDGLSLDAVSDQGAKRITLAEDQDLLPLISTEKAKR